MELTVPHSRCSSEQFSFLMDEKLRVNDPALRLRMMATVCCPELMGFEAF